MNESLHLLTGAYAVGALDPVELAEFEQHLVDCAECAAETRGLLATAARLASAEAVEPPARLKAAVLAQIATTRQLAPLARADAVPAETVEDADRGASESADVAAPAEGGVVVSIRRPGWSWGQKALASAAAVLAVVSIGLSALLAQSSSTRQQLDAQQQTITRVLTASDAHTLAGPVEGGGRGAVVVSPSLGTTVFVASQLPAAPSGHTYELWYLGADGNAVPAGTFVPGADGHATTVLTGAPGQAAAVGMTVEPAGGSPQPTTAPILAVKLA